jgi:3-dehydroquinate synthase
VLRQAGAALRSTFPGDRVFVLTNDTVGPLYADTLKRSLRKSGFGVNEVIVKDGERYKNHRTYRKIIDRLVSFRADRHSALVALGGGVIGDLGGFVAATYMRGMPLVHVPTTLIAQIDSSLGGKVGIDHSDAKNLVGTFYNPELVITDPDVLATLQERDFRNGLFEAIKVAAVANSDLFDFIASKLDMIVSRAPGPVDRMIVACAREKAKVVAEDPFDHGRRMILNFGHTVGHALETSGRYRSISHGEGVGLGMLAALRLSIAMGYLAERTASKISEVILRLTSSRRLKSADPDELWDIIALDKKRRGGKSRFILIKGIGKPVVTEIDKKTFLKSMREL